MDVAIDEGMSKGAEPRQRATSKTPLPEIKKAQKDLGAKPPPDEGSPRASRLRRPVSVPTN
jgi:hypothetical protein